MSATNWAVCPSCLAAANAQKVVEFQAADDAYGKVALPEFDRLRKIADARINTETYRTFREDYEFWIDGDVVKYHYDGDCSVCGSGSKFRGERPITIVVPKAK